MPPLLLLAVFPALNQQRISQSAPVKQGGQLPSATLSGVNQLRLQKMEKERLRLKQELLRQRPQVSTGAVYIHIFPPKKCKQTKTSDLIHFSTEENH